MNGGDIVDLSLRNAGITGVGQVPLSQDRADALSILNSWIGQQNVERAQKVNPGPILPVFPDFTTTINYWEPYWHVLLTSMAVRLRQIYSLPAIDLDVKMAIAALQAFNSINQQQIPPLHGGIPETCEQAIFLALRMAGRITDEQSVADGSKDVNDAFSLLVMMLAQWQRKRWLVWDEQELSTLSTGAMWYGIGPGQSFNTYRPDKIHAAWVRLKPSGGFGVLPEELPFTITCGQGVGSNPVDISLAIIEAREDYSRIAIKDLRSIPSAVFYDSAFPVGRLYFWPVAPANDYSLHVVVKGALPVYESVTDLMGLPPEYVDALVNNLACRIIVASGGQISPFLLGQARASLETIRMANSQIATLRMPWPLGGRRGGDVSSWAGAGLNQAWTVGGPSVLG